MIINIRGTNGSGKSWVVFKLMERFGYTPIYGEGTKQIGVTLGTNASAIGRYLVGTAPSKSGCDIFDKPGDQDVIAALILGQYKGAREHIIFEGLIVSGIYGRWRDFARAENRDFRWVFLNTPLDVCIANVRARRVLAGKPPEFNTANLVSKYKAVEMVRWKAKQDQLKVNNGSSNEVVELISGWIG